MDYFSVSHGEIGLLNENHQALVKVLVPSSCTMNSIQPSRSAIAFWNLLLHVSQVNVVPKAGDSKS